VTLAAAVATTAQTTTKQAKGPSSALRRRLAVDATPPKLEATELKLQLRQAKVAGPEKYLRRLRTDI
jgi:hypothetical protein